MMYNSCVQRYLRLRSLIIFLVVLAMFSNKNSKICTLNSYKFNNNLIIFRNMKNVLCLGYFHLLRSLYSVLLPGHFLLLLMILFLGITLLWFCWAQYFVSLMYMAGYLFTLCTWNCLIWPNLKIWLIWE